jgi:hypothetical protein
VDPSGLNAGPVYISGPIPKVDMRTGNSFLDNTIVGACNTAINTVNSVTNMALNTTATVGEAIEPYEPAIISVTSGLPPQAGGAITKGVGYAVAKSGKVLSYIGRLSKARPKALPKSAVKCKKDALKDVNKGNVSVTKKHSLSKDETRDWYNKEVDKIDTDVKRTKENAEKISNERAKLKRKARDLMKDRDAAAKLDRDYPVQDFNYYKNKYSNPPHNLSGEKLYDKVIGKSKTTNSIVNSKYGKGKK